MKKVKEVPTKLTDELSDLLSEIDFSDTFATTNHIDNLQDVTNLIFNTPTQWVVSLFEFRNTLVKLFGLKTGKPEDYSEEFKVGGYVSFFQIYSVKDNEIVLGANDSHLNFRAIVVNDDSEQYNIKVITLVEYNNLFGIIYMTVIKPFHRLVVKRLVRNSFRLT